MADVLSFNLTNGEFEQIRKFDRPNLSTKLKLLGIDVASFGDFFADRDGPKFPPGRAPSSMPGNIDEEVSSPVKAITYKDPFGSVYKKYLFTPEGRFLVGGMMIGDTRDYQKLSQMVRDQQPLSVPPSRFILGADQDKHDDGSDL